MSSIWGASLTAAASSGERRPKECSTAFARFAAPTGNSLKTHKPAIATPTFVKYHVAMGNYGGAALILDRLRARQLPNGKYPWGVLSEVARELGISRQRVGQVAAAHGITPVRPHVCVRCGKTRVRSRRAVATMLCGPCTQELRRERRHCEWCGTLITRKNHNLNKRYCSRACRTEATRSSRLSSPTKFALPPEEPPAPPPAPTPGLASLYASTLRLLRETRR